MIQGGDFTNADGEATFTLEYIQLANIWSL